MSVNPSRQHSRRNRRKKEEGNPGNFWWRFLLEKRLEQTCDLSAEWFFFRKQNIFSWILKRDIVWESHRTYSVVVTSSAIYKYSSSFSRKIRRFSYTSFGIFFLSSNGATLFEFFPENLITLDYTRCDELYISPRMNMKQRVLMCD